MDKEINKPVILLREEFSNNLASLINSSELPLYVIEPILINTLNEVRTVLQAQYTKELQVYNKAVEELRKKETKEEIEE